MAKALNDEASERLVLVTALFMISRQTLEPQRKFFFCLIFTWFDTQPAYMYVHYVGHFAVFSGSTNADGSLLFCLLLWKKTYVVEVR